MGQAMEGAGGFVHDAQGGFHGPHIGRLYFQTMNELKTKGCFEGEGTCFFFPLTSWF